MIKVLMYGCCGHMGQVISELAGNDPEVEIVAGVDIADKGNTSYPVYTDIRACQEQVDVVVDFSSAKAVDALLDYCGEKGLPVVLCTTGLSEGPACESGGDGEENSGAEIRQYVSGYQHTSEAGTGRCESPCRGRIRYGDRERHHRLKVDAPSGTALALADSLNEAMAANMIMYTTAARNGRSVPIRRSVFPQSGRNDRGRPRGYFRRTGRSDRIQAQAYSKAVFGKGALEAPSILPANPQDVTT